MNLYAYAQIDDIDEIAKRNNINVPRLRGYSLMSSESLIDLNQEIDKKEIAVACVKSLCESNPYWKLNAKCFELSGWTDILKDWFLIKGKNEYGNNAYVDVRWDRIHGWKRKVLKTYIHNEVVKRRKQWSTWNKYVGRDNVLYIHARIGGNNWPYYFKEVIDQPWFLEKIDDAFDSTYCDIYAKINSL